MAQIQTLIRSGANPRLTGIFIALAGAFLMSFDAIFIRLSGVGGVDTAFLFGLFTALSLATVIQVADVRGLVGTLRAGGWPVIASGLLMLGSATSLVFSVKLTSVANTFLILTITPTLAAVFSRIFLGEVTRRATWLAIAGVMLGVGIVVSGSVSDPGVDGGARLLGDGLALVAVTFVALNHTLKRGYPEVSRMATIGLGGLFLALAMAAFASPASYSMTTWLTMAVMGLFSAPFGRVLIGVATRHITAPEVGVISMTSAAFAPLLAFLVFSEVPPVASFVGGAVILGTILSYVVVTSRRATG
ncbi:DMT family transporter [Aliiroseovarius sp.]|uniref:DMT family transporter n=1 Tax=Aliiroseovarius sp. TaxID=1872442 RepID=UPI003BAA2B0F